MDSMDCDPYTVFSRSLVGQGPPGGRLGGGTRSIRIGRMLPFLPFKSFRLRVQDPPFDRTRPPGSFCTAPRRGVLMDRERFLRVRRANEGRMGEVVGAPVGRSRAHVDGHASHTFRHGRTRGRTRAVRKVRRRDERADGWSDRR